jgi:hypothetical protein
MKNLLIFLLFSCLIALVFSQKIRCNKNTDKQIDALLAKVITFGDSGRKFPESQTEIPPFCK